MIKKRKIRGKKAIIKPPDEVERKLKIKKKGMATFKHNVNLHLRRFKDEKTFKLHPKIKYRLTYLLDKMKSEVTLNKKVKFIVDTNWRDQMRKSKLSSLKVDFINQVQLKDINLKTKQKRIEELSKELTECNDVGIHMNRLISFDYKTKMIDNLKDIIQTLNLNYTKQIETIKFEFSSEIKMLEKVHLDRLFQINGYISIIEEISLNELKQLDVNFKQLEDEQNSNHKSEMLSLKVYYEHKKNKLQSILKSLMDDYEKNQKGKLEKYLKLYKVIEESEKSYLKDKKLYKNLLDQYESLKTVASTNHDILKIKKENFKELKSKKDHKLLELDLNRQKTFKSISKLCSITSEVIEALKLKHFKACKIIKLIKACSKLEYFDRYEDNYDNFENLACASFTNASPFNEHNYLVNFYRKYNFLKLNVQMVQIENRKRLEENEYLKRVLSEYLKNL